MFSDRDLEHMKTTLIHYAVDAEKAAEDIVRDVVKEAAEEMYDKINRIDTERMKGSVSHISSKGRGKFGWFIGDTIDNDQHVRGAGDPAKNDYFVYQEHGFRHYKSGKIIAPMHALMSTFVRAREELAERLEKLAKRS